MSSLWARLKGTYGVDLIPEQPPVQENRRTEARTRPFTSARRGARSVARESEAHSSASSSASRVREYVNTLERSLSPQEVDEARELAISGWQRLQTMPGGVQISGQLAVAVRAGDVEGAVDVLVKNAGYRRMEAVAFVAAFMMVLASGQRVVDEAEEADREYRQLISRGLPPINSDEVAMLWTGEAHVACARYQRRSGASEEDARTMIRLAAKMAAAEGDLPASTLPH